jgi:hypothetical protein
MNQGRNKDESSWEFEVNQGNPFDALPRLLPALLLLWRQHGAPLESGNRDHESAVPESELRAMGVTIKDIEWLVTAQYLRYARRSDPGELRYDPAAEPAYLVLTENGIALMETISQTWSQTGETWDESLDAAKSLHAEAERFHRKPHWDRQRRELRYRGMIVKRFNKPAPNQELILAAFEESGWPQRIDDPLPPQGEIVPSVRLHDTLGRLNRSLQNPVLHFGSDGAGQGVIWRLRS